MKNKKEKLERIFQGDQFELLNVQLGTNSKSDSEQRLIKSFQEILSFYEDNDREPEKNGILEFKLYSRLESIRQSPEKVNKLLSYDFYGLLKNEKMVGINPLKTIEEDKYGILEDDEETSIYKLKNVKKTHRIRPDYLSRRRICKDFSTYKPIFLSINQELSRNCRKLIEFDEKMINEGQFFVLNGVLLLIDKLKIDYEELIFRSGNRSRIDGRTRLIFDNGTESDMLYRSLVKALELDGFGISEIIEKGSATEISPDDQQNGFIYVLQSLRKDNNIQSLRNLYKIGYCTGDVNSRIKNASKDPTYLLADVKLVTVFRCFNMSTKKLESSLHTFFDSVRLRIDIDLNDGKTYSPKEWFDVPIEIIEESIELVVKGTINEFYYDHQVEKIIKKG